MLRDHVERDLTSFLTICCECEKVKIEDRWVEISATIRELALSTGNMVPRLSHGVCDTCVTIIMDAMAFQIVDE